MIRARTRAAVAAATPRHDQEESMKLIVPVLAMLAFAPLAHAQDIEAGRARVNEVCAACHGANGVSVSAAIPNLAGQKAAYVGAQLNAFKAGTRKNPIMNAIAAQLSPADIGNVAAYFASLQGAAAGTAMSEFLPNLRKTNITTANFPADYKTRFTRYATVNYPERPQVRHLYANDVALAAAKAGQPVPDGAFMVMEVYTPKLDDQKVPVKGADGNLVPDKLAFIATMARHAGWGKDIPEILRNGDWNYAALNPDLSVRGAANQAECFACHKPLSQDSYLFSLKQLRETAVKQQ
jgi:cytochrome c553